jgi:hypothetical protein
MNDPRQGDGIHAEAINGQSDGSHNRHDGDAHGPALITREDGTQTVIRVGTVRLVDNEVLRRLAGQRI